ncbi:MAG: hypothetical protein M1818_005570 [Claussenomyces sp. TS43310]|nr:MAG: hypothetical protein M1818_005570 [Claussenomyces sp. TS43310]
MVAERHKAKRRTKRKRCPLPAIEQTPSSNSALRGETIDLGDTEVPKNGSGMRISGFESSDDQPRPIVPTEADIVEESLAKTALTKFYHHSINTSTWTVFSDMRHLRIAYVGTPISNLAKLVDEEAEFSGCPNTSLHLPFPSIRPVRPWKPPKSLPLVEWLSTSFADDISALPAKDVRDNLVDSFFTKIHPGFPVVDEHEFRTQYEDKNDPPPLLLLQAVLLTGAHASDHPMVAQSRSLVKMALFRRAKALFDLHYENDRMHIVQAALLFTWHFEGADDVSSNAYYWSGIAGRVAFGLGMHRNLAQTAANRMPLEDRPMYRRIWWTLFQVDVLASLHHGRPPMIDLDECDQPPLTVDDFVENGMVNQNINVEYCVQNATLCGHMILILKSSTPGALKRFRLAPGSSRAAQMNLEAHLASWYLQLPASLANFKSNDADFWSQQLQLHYNLALLHVHRLPHFPSMTSDQAISIGTCHAAAEAIVKLFEDISAVRNIGNCWFTALTLLLAVALQFSHEARAAARQGSTILAIQAQNGLERILPIMVEVSRFWSSAEAIFNLYEDLAKQLKQHIQSSFDFQALDLSPAAFQSPINSEHPTLRYETQDPQQYEDNPGLGSVSVSDRDLQAMFGAGQADSFPDMNYAGMQDWLAFPLNEFAE